VPTAKFPEMPVLTCAKCQKRPEHILEYAELAAERSTSDDPMTPDDVVWLEEGTLDRETGMFLCTEDYIDLGQPASDGGWTATRSNLQKLGVL
jgi:hypothetical protein